MTKTSRYKGLVLGSFLAPEIDMFFGDGVGPPLFEALIANSVLVSCVSTWNSAAEEGAWVGLKLDLQGGTGFNLLRV